MKIGMPIAIVSPGAINLFSRIELKTYVIPAVRAFDGEEVDANGRARPAHFLRQIAPDDLFGVPQHPHRLRVIAAEHTLHQFVHKWVSGKAQRAVGESHRFRKIRAARLIPPCL